MRKILLRVIICCLFTVGITGTVVWSHPAAVDPDHREYIAKLIKEALQVGSVQDPGREDTRSPGDGRRSNRGNRTDGRKE